MRCNTGEWLPPDGDLATRYNAGQEVFSGLISIAAHLVEADELSWLDAIATAASTEQGRRILDWMGVGLVRSDWVNAQTPCVLFECWGAPKDKWRTSKGFACVPEDPKRVVTTLDTERDTLTLAALSASGQRPLPVHPQRRHGFVLHPLIGLPP